MTNVRWWMYAAIFALIVWTFLTSYIGVEDIYNHITGHAFWPIKCPC